SDGSIIAAIIVTQVPRYQLRPTRSVPGPAFIPRIFCTVTIQATRAPPASVAACSKRRRVRSIRETLTRYSRRGRAGSSLARCVVLAGAAGGDDRAVESGGRSK